MNFVTSRYLAFSEPFDDQKGKLKRILFSTRTSATVLIDDSAIQKILDNNYTDFDDELLDLLFSMEIIIPENENEFEEIMIQNNSLLDVNSHLDLTIQPTANCQLGCHYCAQEHSKNNMNNEKYPTVQPNMTYSEERQKVIDLRNEALIVNLRKEGRKHVR